MSTKLEIARIFASVSLIMLIAALVAWASPAGRSQLRSLNDRTAALTVNPEAAALLLLAAVGISVVAAVLASGVWF
ncbi:MAG TPA: hypothetical protein VL336_04760 [Sphingomicrobium sp.]|jgi:hypothetical protein|nr:hypothetical protein [Sphingomicrobium sp.]